ncbi:hypothetical protein O181_104791 [Austropuccinia psidii MF-1]|uniref:Uncharacterized protein n=1 Tax=Austropuccinia psidii MF-1 TaxID=1389203 RepID=A0A9Q3JNB3_9BASI|nr:hypothetical protein [Austropuccinia psidii MF-1]
MGPTGFMAKLVSRRSLPNFGSKGFGDQFWLRCVQLWFGTYLALGARWLHPFGLIGLGQKGPNWPTDRMDHRSHRGSEWPKKAIEAKTPLMKGVGQEPMVMDREPGGPQKTRGPPRPKIKDEGLGFGEVEIGQEGQ